MPMASPAGDTATVALMYAAFILATGAFLVRDVLWLRILASLASLCLLIIAYNNPGTPLWLGMAWYAAFVIINSVHCGIIIYQRQVLRLTEAEARLQELAFPALDPLMVKKLMRRGQWHDFGEGEILAKQGEAVDRLYVLAQGEASVELGASELAGLKPGQFIGEISFLTGDPANATVRATTAVTCLAWDRASLAKTLARHPDLCSVMYGAFGVNLAGKIAAHNLRLADA